MGFVFIAVYIILIGLVLELAASLLVITGLEKDIARFQAISMLTATGFTTMESELIIRHPIRRNIAVFLILFGVFSLAVLISTITSIMEKSFRTPQLITITAGLFIILLAIKTKKIKTFLSGKFHQELQSEFELHQLPIEEVLYTCEEDLVVTVEMFAESEFVDRRADGVFTQEEDMLLLFIQRGHQKIRQNRMNLTIQEGDILCIYGNKIEIENKFENELKKMKQEMNDEQQIVGYSP